MQVYQGDPAASTSTWLQQASMLEQRLELGHYLSDEARAWLLKPSQPERWAVWRELLVRADINGVCRLDNLEAMRYFDTARRRGYLVKQFAEYGLVRVLEHGLVQVLS
jgi:hypothetical protein